MSDNSDHERKFEPKILVKIVIVLFIPSELYFYVIRWLYMYFICLSHYVFRYLASPKKDKKSPSTPKSSKMKNSPQPAYRVVDPAALSSSKRPESKSSAEARSSLSSQSLRDYVTWTPISQQSPRSGSKAMGRRSIGRMIVDSVLDEQPLFFDSPATGDNSAVAGISNQTEDCAVQ